MKTSAKLIDSAKNEEYIVFSEDIALHWDKPNIVVYRTTGLWVILAKLDTKDYSKHEIVDRLDRWRAGDYPDWLSE